MCMKPLISSTFMVIYMFRDLSLILKFGSDKCFYCVCIFWSCVSLWRSVVLEHFLNVLRKHLKTLIV